MEKELKKRWETLTGQKKLHEVIHCLGKGKSLSKVHGLEKYCGRWDLRGAKLSSLAKEHVVKVEEYKHTRKLGTLKLVNCSYSAIDFSYADISYSMWRRVNLENCIFHNAICKELYVVASSFKQCVFNNANLADSQLNINIGQESGSFKQVEFIKCNLSKCSFTFPKIENCLFDECKMVETNFDGSRFKDCTFKGEIKSAWFGGYAEYPQKDFISLFKKKMKVPKNEMINVDFSECYLDDVLFQNEINLEHCIFPKEEKYIIVRNLPTVYEKLKNLIKNEWEGENKRITLSWINDLHYSEKKQNMNLDIINKDCISPYFPEELYFNFFHALEKINNEVNQGDRN